LFIFRSVLTEMGNVSHIILEKIKTNLYVWKFFFRNLYLSWDTVKRYGTVKPEATDDNVIWRLCVACWITKATNTDTHTIKILILLLSTVTMSTRTHHNVTLYVHSCFVFLSLQLFLFCLGCLLKVITWRLRLCMLQYSSAFSVPSSSLAFLLSSVSSVSISFGLRTQFVLFSTHVHCALELARTFIVLTFSPAPTLLPRRIQTGT